MSTPAAETRADVYRFTLPLAALTCALTPAYVIRWHVSFYPSTVLEDAILLTIMVFVIESWRAKLSPAFPRALLIPTAVFVVAGAISVVVAPDLRAALGIYRAYLLEPIAFAVVLATVIRNVRHVWLLLAGLAVAGAVVSVANAAYVLDQLKNNKVDPAITGPVVIYTNANDVALFLVPLIAIAGSEVLFGSHQRIRIAAAVFAAIALVATLLSFSRGGYLALAVVAIALAVAHHRRLWLLGGALAAGIVLVLIPPITRRVAVEVDFHNPANTLVGRFGLWQATLQMLQHHPIFGGGLSGFAATIAPYWNPYHPDRFIYPHNIVLTFWSETGLLGLIAFAWILVAAFLLCLRGWRRGQVDWRPFCLGVLIAILAIVTHGLVDVPYFKNDLALEFWALLGMVAAGAVAGAIPRAVGRG